MDAQHPICENCGRYLDANYECPHCARLWHEEETEEEEVTYYGPN